MGTLCKGEVKQDGWVGEHNTGIKGKSEVHDAQYRP
jgi:hypothetical protein